MANVALREPYASSTMPYKVDDPGEVEWITVTTGEYRVSLPSAFEQAINFFSKNNVDIEKAFSGKYIAIWQDTILDSDTNFSQLASRIYEQFGYLPIYMPFVGPKIELQFRSPRIVKAKRDESST